MKKKTTIILRKNFPVKREAVIYDNGTIEIVEYFYHTPREKWELYNMFVFKDFEINKIAQFLNENDEWIIVSAFRYCLGRMTYIVSMMVEYLINVWDRLSQNTKDLILKEIKLAIEEGRAGSDIDVKEWEKILKLSQSKVSIKKSN